MVLLVLIVISAFGAISAVDSEIDRQNNDNYESGNRYRPTEGSSYGSSGGLYSRNLYDGLNQNRYNVDLSGREFRPTNVFGVGLLSSPSPYVNPLLAQPRQYGVSVPVASGPLPYQLPLLQSPGYNSYGGPPARVGMSNIGQGYDYGNYMTNPYYGIGNRQSLAFSQPNHMSPYSIYGAQGLYSTPYSPQIPNYQPLGYANPTSGYPTFGPQFAANPYSNQPFSTGQLGYTNGYNNYNNYNNNNDNYNGVNSNSGLNSGLGSGLGSSLGSGQSSGSDSNSGDRNYASSASTQNEMHSGPQPSNDVPVFHSNRIIKRNGFDRSVRI